MDTLAPKNPGLYTCLPQPLGTSEDRRERPDVLGGAVRREGRRPHRPAGADAVHRRGLSLPRTVERARRASVGPRDIRGRVGESLSPRGLVAAALYLESGSRFRQVGRVAVPLPPVQPSDVFTHLETQRQELQSGLRRRIAPDAVAVADVELRPVKRGGRFGAYLPVRETDRIRDVLVSIGCQSPGSIGQSSPGSLSHPVGL